MKRLIIVSGSIALWTSLALAAGRSTSAPREACQQIEAACVEAGYATGPKTPKGKRLFRDCVRPIMDGQTVSGVILDPTLPEACRARGRQHK